MTQDRRSWGEGLAGCFSTAQRTLYEGSLLANSVASARGLGAVGFAHRRKELQEKNRHRANTKCLPCLPIKTEVLPHPLASLADRELLDRERDIALARCLVSSQDHPHTKRAHSVLPLAFSFAGELP